MGWRTIDADRHRQLLDHTLAVRRRIRDDVVTDYHYYDATRPIYTHGRWITSGCPYPMGSFIDDVISYDWSPAHQHAFETTLNTAGFDHDRVARFIADLGWHWSSTTETWNTFDGHSVAVPWLEPFAPGISTALHDLGKTRQFRNLTIARSAQRFGRGVAIDIFASLDDTIERRPVPAGDRPQLIAHRGIAEYVGTRFTIPPDQPRPCAICHDSLWPATIDFYFINRFGPPRYCLTCLNAISSRVDPWRVPELDPDTSIAMAIDAVHLFHQLTGHFPSRDAKRPSIAHGSDDERDTWVQAVMMLPGHETATELFGGWTEMLAAAGVLDSRPRRGQSGYVTQCSDGHIALSLAERAICEYLWAHDIVHDKEPLYPHDDELNPKTKLRADWQIGTRLIEYAGRMDDASYARNIGRKQQLADRHGLELLIIYPADLRQLHQFADRHLRGGT